ncbi:MORN repeat-containing protein [Noumeavirus]|uniref:MORN repeat-containing protein n=1 Tax=Noumeavirus TaxID=1955558 RepID=UPI000982EE94|nr:MORN repeat-containing protein [Noumeavirus]AQM73371.1 MORN repeat-containing protein [Noumeavirus]
MASLKLLCASKVSEKTGISELDEYVSRLSDFVQRGEDGIFDGIFVRYNVLARFLFGWRYFEYRDERFFLDSDDNLCGPYKEICGDVVLLQSFYRNRQLDGPQIIRSPSGVKKRQIFWVNGKKHGIETEWYNDGSLASKTEYVNGVQHGEFTIYSVSLEKKNQVVAVLLFENGEMVGKKDQ